MSHLNTNDQTTAVVWQRPDGTEFLLPSRLIGLLNEASQAIYEADHSGHLAQPTLFLTSDALGIELRGDDAIWAAMNEASSNAEDHERVVDYAYSLLPGWAKSREKLEAKFNVRFSDVLLNVSHGFFRGDLSFVEATALSSRDDEKSSEYLGQSMVAH